jgi:hypothetical protein
MFDGLFTSYGMLNVNVLRSKFVRQLGMQATAWLFELTAEG